MGTWQTTARYFFLCIGNGLAIIGLGGCEKNLTQSTADQICSRSTIYPAATSRAEKAENELAACQTAGTNASEEASNALDAKTAELAEQKQKAGTLEAKSAELQAQIDEMSSAKPLYSIRFTYPSDNQASCVAKMQVVLEAIGDTAVVKNVSWVQTTTDSCRIVAGCPKDRQYVTLVTCRVGEAKLLREQVETAYAQ